AGATHAEIINLEDSPDQKFRSKNGLLISDVSNRVMKNARYNSRFKKNIELVTSTEGSLNIELLISLIEINRIPDSDFKINYLKRLIHDDIKDKLSDRRRKKFYLHKALFELHSKITDKEEVLGIISLNYDGILDEAYKIILGTKPNYCFTSERGESVPLLKLHGSFDWGKVNIYGKQKKIPIIPLGINKNYLIPPYNFIWSRAFEVMLKCDILRIIGCSLSPNDIGLIDLLFKAHLERASDLEIQIIDFPETGDQIKNSYGFFKKIVKLGDDIKEPPVADVITDVGNPFKVWLKAMGLHMLDELIKETKYLKKCL
ncbi:MAG: hypothetical protein HY757_09870, partial [Nitrospirae bacterium]|nr:hypothetical protein [Nitrospirota bacterium]